MVSLSPKELTNTGFWKKRLTADIFKLIILNETAWLYFQISKKFVPYGPIHKNLSLVQVMAWHQAGDKPLPETMMTQFTDAFMHQ